MRRMVELPKEHVQKFRAGLKLMRKVIQNIRAMRQRFVTMDSEDFMSSPQMRDTMTEYRAELKQWMAVGESAMRNLQSAVSNSDDYNEHLTGQFQRLQEEFRSERQQLEREEKAQKTKRRSKSKSRRKREGSADKGRSKQRSFGLRRRSSKSKRPANAVSGEAAGAGMPSGERETSGDVEAGEFRTKCKRCGEELVEPTPEALSDAAEIHDARCEGGLDQDQGQRGREERGYDVESGRNGRSHDFAQDGEDWGNEEEQLNEEE